MRYMIFIFYFSIPSGVQQTKNILQKCANYNCNFLRWKVSLDIVPKMFNASICLRHNVRIQYMSEENKCTVRKNRRLFHSLSGTALSLTFSSAVGTYYIIPPRAQYRMVLYSIIYLYMFFIGRFSALQSMLQYIPVEWYYSTWYIP